MRSRDERAGSWTLLTGHGHVLVEVARNPRARIRDIAPIVGLTGRSVQAIVTDLEAEGLPDPYPYRTAHPVHRPPRQAVPARGPGWLSGRSVPRPARRGRR